MTLSLIKSEHDMDLVIHGVNNQKKFLKLSNYSLTIQIVIINLSTACFALIFILIFNIYLLINNQNIENQKNFIENKERKMMQEIEDKLIEEEIRMEEEQEKNNKEK